MIDIKNGNCVRTRQGQYVDLEVYSHFPEKVAKNWELQGARYLHVIDLDAAMAGHSVNHEIIEEIISNVSIPVQVGGGIRTIKDIENKLRIGASRVIIGTKAATNPAFVKEAINIFGADKIVVSIDVKRGSVVMDGWQKVSSHSPVMLAKAVQEMGIKTIIYTDVLKDGMLQGPNLEFSKEMVKESKLDVIVSGGVSSLKDLELISENQVHGVLLGKALYENKIDLKNAIDMFDR